MLVDTCTEAAPSSNCKVNEGSTMHVHGVHSLRSEKESTYFECGIWWFPSFRGEKYRSNFFIKWKPLSFKHSETQN